MELAVIRLVSSGVPFRSGLRAASAEVQNCKESGGLIVLGLKCGSSLPQLA